MGQLYVLIIGHFLSIPVPEAKSEFSRHNHNGQNDKMISASNDEWWYLKYM